MILPFKGTYTRSQEFNDSRYRSSYAKFNLLGHNGWDYAMPVGSQLISPHHGKITENAFDQSGYGWYIKIENDKEFSILAHLKQASGLKIGTEVKEGDTVGVSGNTGNSTGPHLHWGYGRFPRNKDNGFNGYIDQTHWLDLKCDCTAVEQELDDMRASRNDWRDKAKKAIAEGKPITAYKVMELFNALGSAIKEGRW